MEEPKKTWYSIHKEQIKLIQWLLYHLNKSKAGGEKEKGRIEKVVGDFKVEFP